MSVLMLSLFKPRDIILSISLLFVISFLIWKVDNAFETTEEQEEEREAQNARQTDPTLEMSFDDKQSYSI